MPSPPPPRRTSDVLRGLRERFRASSAETVEGFRLLARRLAGAPSNVELVETLRQDVHRVRGTAGSYGYVDASRLAALLEERVVRWVEEPELDREERATIVDHFVSALTFAFESADAASSDSPRRRLLLLDGDAERAEALRAEAPLHGFEVRVLEPGRATPTAVREVAPHLVVATDARLDEARDAALTVSARLVVLANDVAATRRALEKGPVPPAGALDAGADGREIFELASRLASRSSYRGGTVLVVDDDPLVLALARYVVQGADTRVVTLERITDLVGQVESVAPALLVMDVRPGHDSGIELTRALRAQPGLRDLPIILLSSDSGEEVRRVVFEAGADEFIAKPIVPAELRRRIADRLERHRLRRLAEELDPRSGLPLPLRTRRETTAFITLLQRERLGGSVAAIGPAARPTALAEDAWLDEAVRIARALVGGGAVVGFDDESVLFVALGADAATAGARLARHAGDRPADAPAWHAGVAAADGTGDRTPATLRQGALDALRAAVAEEVPVRQWAGARSSGSMPLVRKAR